MRDKESEDDFLFTKRTVAEKKMPMTHVHYINIWISDVSLTLSHAPISLLLLIEAWIFRRLFAVHRTFWSHIKSTDTCSTKRNYSSCFLWCLFHLSVYVWHANEYLVMNIIIIQKPNRLFWSRDYGIQHFTMGNGEKQNAKFTMSSLKCLHWNDFDR